MVFRYLMRGNVCTICAHPRTQAIDSALMEGGKLIPVAGQFGVAKSSLARHKNNCLAPRLQAVAKLVTPQNTIREPVERAKRIVRGEAPTVDDVLGLSGLLDRLARSLERLEGAADHAALSKAHLALASLSGQISKAVETSAKLQGIGRHDDAPPDRHFTVQIHIPDRGMPPMRTIDATAAKPEGATPILLGGVEIGFDERE